MKTALGLIRDHSGSMQNITRAAAADYNASLLSAQESSRQFGINTFVTVAECGGGYRFVERNQPIDTIRQISPAEYRAPGLDTPLFRTVEAMIDALQASSDPTDKDTNFLIIATTDGGDNVTRHMGARQLVARMRELQKTDRWTFVFRVPRGYAKELTQFGFEPGNILEWEQTSRGVETASTQTNSAMSGFYAGTASGTKSTRTFYTSAATVTEQDVQKLGDISSQVSLWPIAASENGSQIRDFVESRLGGKAMLKGAAFYQLIKTEDKIQDYKLVAIRDKDTGAVYCGPEARDLIGLPRHGDVRVKPDTAGKWQIFIQSTSVNRKVSGGSQLMYWPGVGAKFKEGKSAR